MQWPARMIDGLWNDQGETDPAKIYVLLDNMRSTIDSISISTAFSGIDTPAVALSMLSIQVAQELEIDLQSRPMFNNIFGVEWFGKSADVLLQSPHGPKCLFTDASHFWSDCMAHKVDGLLQQGRLVEVIKPLMKTGNIGDIMSRCAFCVKCQKPCEVSLLVMVVVVQACLG